MSEGKVEESAHSLLFQLLRRLEALLSEFRSHLEEEGKKEQGKMFANFRNQVVRESAKMNAAEQADDLRRWLIRISEGVREANGDVETPEERAAEHVRLALEELRSD